jgi:hypothetical protein
MGRHEQGESGEGELQGALRQEVRGGHSGQHAERGEGADDERLAGADIAVPALAGGADEGDDHDHQQRGRLAFDLAKTDEDGQRGDEQNAAADSDQPTGQASRDADEDGEDLFT